MSGTKPRKSPSNPNRARLQKEIGSICPFCPDDDVAHFEVHHIDGDRSNDSIANLIMICRKCHSKITKGEILEDKVRKKKLLLTARTGNPATSQSRVFSRREREFFEYAFTKLDEMVRVPVTRVDVEETPAETWRLGHWDVRISYLELLLWCYLDQPQHFSFISVLQNLRFEAMTSPGFLATFRMDHPYLQHLWPEPVMEQLGFVTVASGSNSSRRYTRSMHQFALWIDVNNMAPKILEAEWIAKNETSKV